MLDFGIRNKDQVNGRIEEAKGAAKNATGNMVGNDHLAAEGAVENTAGKAQAHLGDAKEKLGDDAKKATDN